MKKKNIIIKFPNAMPASDKDKEIVRQLSYRQLSYYIRQLSFYTKGNLYVEPEDSIILHLANLNDKQSSFVSSSLGQIISLLAKHDLLSTDWLATEKTTEPAGKIYIEDNKMHVSNGKVSFRLPYFIQEAIEKHSNE